VGKKADLLVVSENPLANFKLLYGTGHYRLMDDGKPGRERGLRYTIKDGIVYDVNELLEDVRNIVAAAKADQ
jgi:imidazolonepropionase-like amidohydrolase